MATKNKFDWTRSVRIGLFTAMVCLFGLVFAGFSWVDSKITATIQHSEGRIIEVLKEAK